MLAVFTTADAAVLGSIVTTIGLVIVAVLGQGTRRRAKQANESAAEAVKELTSPNSGSFNERVMRGLDDLREGQVAIEGRLANVEGRMASVEGREVKKDAAVKRAGRGAR